jgi:hypothetical protein
MAPPNSKPTQPGFGPALKRLGRTPASRRHAGCRSRVAVQRYTRQPTCRYSRRRAARAAQLSLKHVSPTRASVVQRQRYENSAMLARTSKASRDQAGRSSTTRNSRWYLGLACLARPSELIDGSGILDQELAKAIAGSNDPDIESEHQE